MQRTALTFMALAGLLLAALVTTQSPVGADIGSVTCHGKRATIAGTSGSDTLLGTPHTDVIVGLRGHDVIYSGKGRDTICSGAGDDVIGDGLGGDRAWAGPGADLIRDKRAGGNRLYGAPGPM
jgi:Ca2+-binding RTX toxin-like protein